MVEPGKTTGPVSGSTSRPASSFESSGDRIRFTVELFPNETNIVSWKKLLREANSVKDDGPAPPVPLPNMDAHEKPIHQDLKNDDLAVPISVNKPVENEAKDPQSQAGSNRLGTVIERIERMYAGNSTDEEDVALDGTPDDDEYDTEDSFIDDAELDDYFQVDNSATKHDGYFVNRGKLERLEPSLPASKPKKRRHKDMANGGSEDGPSLNKRLKMGTKVRKASSLMERNSGTLLHEMPVPTSNNGKVKDQASSQNTEVSIKKKTVGSKATMNSSQLSNGNFVMQGKDIDQQRTLMSLSKNHKSKKESARPQNTSIQLINDQGSCLNKPCSEKKLNGTNELDQPSQQKEKSRHVGFNVNIPVSKDQFLTPKAPSIQGKDGSSVMPKSSMLEKAVIEFEKVVAEYRPPTAEVQGPDNSSQGAKKRLPPEIKQKLAKVARFAQASNGKIPQDLVNRLMSIAGHLMHVRTLKRNLKAMIIMGLSAKQEKDNKVQKLKQKVTEMVNLRISLADSKSDQQATNSDDFQDAGPKEKEASSRKYDMDDALEDKICDLYDLYVQRLEEHSGPSIRRLYEELTALWPKGAVDTAGIKRAICRAKYRRKVLRTQQLENKEKMKKNVLTPKTNETTREGNAKPKQDRTKGSSSISNLIIALPSDVLLLPEKKVKRKPNIGSQVSVENSQVQEVKKKGDIVAVPLIKSKLSFQPVTHPEI